MEERERGWGHALIGTASRACTQTRVEAHKHTHGTERTERIESKEWVGGERRVLSQCFKFPSASFFSPRWALTENYSISVSICPQTLIKNLLSVWYGAKWGPTRGQPSDNERTTKAGSCGKQVVGQVGKKRFTCAVGENGEMVLFDRIWSPI